MPAWYVGAGIQTQVLVTVQNTFLTTEPSLHPDFSILFYFFFFFNADAPINQFHGQLLK